MNLIIGLAVDNIQEMKDKAEFKKLSNQVFSTDNFNLNCVRAKKGLYIFIPLLNISVMCTLFPTHCNYKRCFLKSICVCN